MSDSIKELINAFNLNNYAVNGVNTNFTVDGKKIVGLFAYNVDVARYLQRIGEEIIKQQYNSREVANRHYNLSCFPFVLNSKEKEYSKNVKKVKLADCNDKVIRNLKIHFANEFERAVIFEVAHYVAEEVQISKDKAHEWIRETVKTGTFDESNPLKKDYLYCIAFDGKYFEREGYDSETFELFKEVYIQKFNSRLRNCGLKDSDFYKDRDGMLYIKNVDDEVIKSVTKHVKKEVAFDFKTPGSVESKVENCKNVINDLIFKITGKTIDGYDRYFFKDKRNNDSFVLVPLTKTDDGQFESLSYADFFKINQNELFKNSIRDVRDKALYNIRGEALDINREKPLYAFSNKGIAQLLPEVMQSPIAYNGRTGHFEFAADLGPSSSVESPRPGSVVSPVSSVRKTEVAVPAADAKNNPDLSMSGQNPDEDYMQDSSQSVNTRDLSDAERIRKRRNSDGRNLSADSALSSEFDASRPPSGTGMTDNSGVYSSQEFLTSDPELDRGYPSRASSRSVSSLSSSASDTPVGTVIGVEEDSSSELSESSPSRSASSEPPEKKSGRFSFTHDPGLPNGDIYDENMLEPSAKLLQMKLESPQRDRGKELKRCPRLESEEGGLQSSGYQLPTQLSFTKVSGSQSQQSVSAVYNVQARNNTQPQQMNPSLQQGTHENKWSQSGHSSRTSAWSQPMGLWSLPALSGYIPGFLLPTQVDSRDKPLTEKEKELIKALLYAFNLNNYIWECPHTNFIVENGKIASSINDDVNVKEYLQELRDCTIKEYCGTEEEAKEAYDLNEFPFKFLSNCEKNQETTVVANISRGALLNLKKLFIQHEQGVEIENIDINTVEKAVEFQKNRWVNSQVKGGHCGPQAAIENCYPDESNLKHIPIIKDKGGYCLDRTYDTWEVGSYMKERWPAKDTSKAKKTKPEDNKDSGYSSGFTTDAEKGKKSPKRRSQSPVGGGSPEKSPRRDSSTLDAANFTQQPDISKSDRFSDKSSREGFPDTGGGINMQYTGARKKITGESDICSANPWAVVPGTAFVLGSVSHVKGNIDKLGEDFSGAIKVTEEGKFGSSKLEPRHQWLDRERHRRSTKQATEEESISNWVWE